MKKQRIDIDLMSVPEDSMRLSTLLGRFLDDSQIPERAKYDIMISCDEVFSNIYMHAYKRVPDGRIQFNAEVSPGCITVTFTDHGKGMPGDQPVNLPEGGDSEGGYGLFIIHELMDEVQTNRTGAANTITMKKRYT